MIVYIMLIKMDECSIYMCRRICMSSSSYFPWAVKWWNSYIWGRKNITTLFFRFTWEFNSLCNYPVLYLIFHDFVFFYWEFLGLTGCINTLCSTLQGSVICKIVLSALKKFVRNGLCSLKNVHIFCPLRLRFAEWI